MLIDCHVHRGGGPNATVDILNEQVSAAQQQGVGAWIVNGGSVVESSEVVSFVEGRQNTFACVGVHPRRSDTFDENAIAELAVLAERSDRVVGIGEIGIDFARSKIEPEIQINVFRQMIRLARNLHLPMNLHIYGRESGETLIDILKEERGWEVGGVLHNFMGSEEFGNQLLELGIYPSVSVVIMHPRADRLRSVYRQLPLGGLVIDTDWPGGLLDRTEGEVYPFDLDKKSELINLARYAERLAEEKGVSVEQVADITGRNTMRAFPKLAAALRP